jgi:hypothetical protein
VSALLNTPYQQAFSPGTLGVAEYARSLWTSSSDEAKALLMSIDSAQDPNSLTRAFVDGIAAAVTPAELIEIASFSESVLRAVIDTNPALIASSETWRRSLNEQYQLWIALKQLHLSDALLIEQMIHALIDAGADHFAEDVADQFQELIVPGVLSWVETRRDDSRTIDAWRRVLESRRLAVLDWLDHAASPATHTMALIAQILSPRHGNPLTTGELSRLMHAGERAAQAYLTDTKVEMMAFLLSLGLRESSDLGESLSVLAFQTVHTAAADSALSDEAWVLLEPSVPFLWSRNWDRCQRLRQALVDAFIRYRWTPVNLIRAAPDINTLDGMVAFATETRDGRRFLKTLKGELERSAQLSEEQKAIVTKVLQRHDDSTSWWWT